ncbi:hypothetical protein GCM10009643_09200 [Microbacterium aurantiacum]
MIAGPTDGLPSETEVPSETQVPTPEEPANPTSESPEVILPDSITGSTAEQETCSNGNLRQGRDRLRPSKFVV